MKSPSSLLERLAGVKQTGAGRWMAKCPAHEDGSPSLSIRETGDGRMLLHCFGGCETCDVLTTLGLEMSNLFDRPLSRQMLPPVRGGFTARELLELLHHEITVAAMLATHMETRPLTGQEAARLRQASARIGKAQEMLNDR
jgi:hypothetical protein